MPSGSLKFIPDNSDYQMKIRTFTYKTLCFIDSVLIGDFDLKYNFINPKDVISLRGGTNEIEYSLKPQKTGDNLIMGVIFITSDSIIDGELFQREFIFYKDFYV